MRLILSLLVVYFAHAASGCPTDACSGHGSCLDNICTCDEGYRYGYNQTSKYCFVSLENEFEAYGTMDTSLYNGTDVDMYVKVCRDVCTGVHGNMTTEPHWFELGRTHDDVRAFSVRESDGGCYCFEFDTSSCSVDLTATEPGIPTFDLKFDECEMFCSGVDCGIEDCSDGKCRVYDVLGDAMFYVLVLFFVFVLAMSCLNSRNVDDNNSNVENRNWKYINLRM